MHLSLSLLGVFEARLNGKPVTEFYSSKARALLAYLAVEAEQPHPRPMLAALLYPEWADRAALGNLRFSLSKLRQAIQDQDAVPPFLLINRECIQLNPTATVTVDIHLFRQELRASRWESADVDGQPDRVVRSALKHLTIATDLVRGPFLVGFTVGDSVAFEEWALQQRVDFEREARRAFHGLTALYQRLGDHAAAERSARRLLSLDPWDELANRRLMAILAAGGWRNAALHHYAAYRGELARELGCEPEAETQALYAQIRAGSLPQPHAPSAPAGTLAPDAGGGEEDRHPLRFVARSQELARLSNALAQAVAGRGAVALIAGEAGAGKTALLDEFARQAGQEHPGLIAVHGSCNAHAGIGDAYLPFREILQTLVGDVEGKRASGTLSPEQAQRVREAEPAVIAILVEHGPDLIDRFVPGEALLRRAERIAAPPSAGHWQERLRELVLSHSRVDEPAPPDAGTARPAPQPDLFAQVTQVLHTVSMERPLLLAIDDVQWAGACTAALLFHLGRRLAGSRILLACAFRPQALAFGDGDLAAAPTSSAPGPAIGAVLQELTRLWGDILIDLDEVDGREFVEAYLDSEPNRLGAAFRRALYDHSGGNPLFTIELLRGFQREGALLQDATGCWVEAAAPNWERRPPRVEAVIAGQLAGLPQEDRALLQAASIQGEQFVAEVAGRVLGWSDEAVLRRLSGPLRIWHRLVEAVSLDRLATSEQYSPAGSGSTLSRYRFRHALVQSSAYRSLNAVEQARLHEATARTLEAIYGQTAGQPTGGQAGAPSRSAVAALAPELARHYEAAGLLMESAHYRLLAGRWATRLVAYDEAIAHLERGLNLMDSVPASTERLRVELGLCQALVNPMALRRGWRAPAFTRVRDRLSRLAQRPELQRDPQCVSVLTVLALLSIRSADVECSRRLAERLLSLAQTGGAGELGTLMLSHWVLGHCCTLQGQLAAAREHLEQALALHNPDAGRALTPPAEADPEVAGQVLLGVLWWQLGYPDQGRAGLRHALALAEAIDRPPALGFAHLVAGITSAICNHHGPAALHHAQALRSLADAGLEYPVWSDLLAAWVQARDDWLRRQASAGGAGAPHASSVVRAAQAVSALYALGPGAGYGEAVTIYAHICTWAGEPEMGLSAIDEALAWIDRTGMRMHETEVWRTRGELLLSAGGAESSDAVDRAEACFQRALEVARDQQARWLELRAAVSLSRLWQAQGRARETRELLAGLYGWFAEGFDLPDLQEAKALLESTQTAGEE